VAIEENKEIFKDILEPLIVDPVTKLFKKQQLDANGATNKFEDEELLVPVIVPCNQYCK
jgi:hypothetical protein